MEQRFLTIKDTCEYLNIGETKLRSIIKQPDCKFAIKIGNRWRIDKSNLDKYINNCIKYQIEI